MEGGQSDSEPDNPHWDWSEEHPYSQYGYSGYYPPYYDSSHRTLGVSSSSDKLYAEGPKHPGEVLHLEWPG